MFVHHVGISWQVVPKFYSIRKVSGDVAGMENKEEFKAILAEMQKLLTPHEKELGDKKYFGGDGLR